MLPNGLRLHLAHDPAASRAAAWLRVAAGSHDEPSAHPGLAHFLEHLSFLGGAAFPGDERLMAWLQVRGGQVNASTRGRTTDYFFEVTAEHLGAGLARLIDMLARPLLDIDAQRREREVLEAEYLARSADEQTLIDAALALGLPAGHPLRRFAAGRRDSLALENDAFQRALREFHAAHYHAGNCQLWLQGPQALDELERLAQRACADLPGRAPGASPPPPPLLPFAGGACRDRRGWCWALPSTLCGRPTNRPCRRSPNCSAIARRAGCWQHSANRAWANRRRCGWFTGMRGRRSWR